METARGNFPPSHHAQLVLPHSSTHISTAPQRRTPGHVWRCCCCCCCIRAAILHLTGHTLVTNSSHTRHTLIMIKKNLLFRCHCRVMGEDLRGNNTSIKPPSRCAFILTFTHTHTRTEGSWFPSGCSIQAAVPPSRQQIELTAASLASWILHALREQISVHFKSTCRD